MRIRKRQHPIAHGITFILTGGASAPVSAAMMGSKAARNRAADHEVEYLAGGSPRQRAQNEAAQQIIDHDRAVRAARALLAAEEGATAAAPPAARQRGDRPDVRFCRMGYEPSARQEGVHIVPLNDADGSPQACWTCGGQHQMRHWGRYPTTSLRWD